MLEWKTEWSNAGLYNIPLFLSIILMITGSFVLSWFIGFAGSHNISQHDET